MKVSSTAAPVSALETWLQNSESAVAESAANPATVTGLSGPTQPRDSAERLLDLSAWGDGSAHARTLITTAAAPQPTDRFAQQWSEHIFTPLQ
jgi:hypothetical protein